MNPAELLRHDAAHFAERTALRLDGRELTFRQLARLVDDQVQFLGQYLAPGDRVALWFHNSFSWLAAFIALNALGAVSVPINTRLTAAELQVILRDVRARALITVSHYRGRNYLDEAVGTLDALDDGTIVFDASDDRSPGAWPMIRERGPLAPRTPAGVDDDLLCIQYTSGTTALPKGAMLTNRAYLQTAAYVARCQRLTPNSSFISAAPFFIAAGRCTRSPCACSRAAR